MSLGTPYQNIIHLSRYARKDRRTGRRETWGETAGRYLQFMQEHLERNHKCQLSPGEEGMFEDALGSLSVMPSMRTLMAAGPMLAAEHLTGYNCSYAPVDSPRAFDEALYLLMCTVGVGFSVERQNVAKLPLIPPRFRNDPNAFIDVPDTRIGWAQSLRKLIDFLYAGVIPVWSTAQVRPKGAELRTTGGTASGPEPLENLFRFTIRIFEGAKGRRLTSLECHDLMCHVGDIVMVGNVRQAAMISLSNLSDQRMRGAKSGNWYSETPWRQLSNNSVAYTEVPTAEAWLDEWTALVKSKSGERGVFNRVAAQKKAQSIGRKVTWTNGDDIEFGCNPCAEIDLRPMELCNLSEVVARSDDSWDTLVHKVRIAATFGTWQSTLTSFKHLRKRWRQNCEEERLLGISITGIMDCPLLNRVSRETNELLDGLRGEARKTNREWAERLGITPSVALTCVKPSGTVSQLVGSASGIHARFARHYIRRINISRNNPVSRFLIDHGFPHEPHYTKPNDVQVFMFPTRAPEGAIVEGERSAIETLEHWRMFRRHWCDHNPSTTIQVSEREWPEVGGWVYKNFEEIGGLSFFPKSDAVYRQAPFEAVSEESCAQLETAMPTDAPWGDLVAYEDSRVRRLATKDARPDFACTAGACERA